MVSIVFVLKVNKIFQIIFSRPKLSQNCTLYVFRQKSLTTKTIQDNL